MSRIRALLIGLLALTAIAMASATASADRISPGGAITADFPNVGSISLTVGANVSNCPLRLIGTINTTKSTLRNGDITIGNIASANPNPIGPIPGGCSQNRVTLDFSAGAWLIAAASLQVGGGINIIVRGVTAVVDVGITCVFRGDVTALILDRAITNVGGSLSGACGTATVGGTGGILTPGQRLIV